MAESYATSGELAEWIGNVDANAEAGRLDTALDAASRLVEDITGRTFYVDGSTSTRDYWPDDYRTVTVGDISTLTGVVLQTDEDDDGTFETTRSASDYQVLPVNNPSALGRPWTKLRIVGTSSSLFRVCGYHSPIRVTATWGWPAVPGAVKEATLIAAANLWKRKDAPFGVAGFAEFGVLRIRDDPDVKALLKPFSIRYPAIA